MIRKTVFSVAAAALLAGAAFAQSPARDRHVIVISLDGFPAYALNDPNLPIPNIRKLIAEGSMAKAMTTVNPTVTWPNHTAMVTGVDASQHGLLVNGTIMKTGAWPPMKVEPWIEKEKMVHVPTVYDAAHKAGLTTAQVDWVAIKSAPTITWEFPEVPSLDGKIEKEMIAKGLVDAALVEGFRKPIVVRRDQVWTDAGVYLIKEKKPNLLLFHLLSLDGTHHSFGPRTLAAADAIGFVDSCVARLVEAVKAAGLQDKTTFIIVSDHGFRTVNKQIHPVTVLTQAKLQDKVHVISEGGTALVYAPADLVAQVKQLMTGVEGVEEVAGVDRYAAMGLPDPAVDPQMSSLFLVAKRGYQFSSVGGPDVITTPRAPLGTHGCINTDPEMDAIFIASGAGIKKGAVVERIHNYDVAPTIAELLGVKMAGAIKGKTVREVLK